MNIIETTVVNVDYTDWYGFSRPDETIPLDSYPTLIYTVASPDGETAHIPMEIGEDNVFDELDDVCVEAMGFSPFGYMTVQDYAAKGARFPAGTPGLVSDE